MKGRTSSAHTIRGRILPPSANGRRQSDRRYSSGPTSSVHGPGPRIWHTAYLSLALCVFFVMRAHALDPNVSMSQYAHNTWKIQDGEPPSPINTIVQAADGYLWMVANNSVLKFDGVRFSQWPIPEPLSGLKLNQRRLLKTQDGSVWFATPGTVFEVKGENFVSHNIGAGWIAGTQRDAAGDIWITHTPRKTADPSEVCRLHNGIVHCFGAAEGFVLPINHCCLYGFALDSSGTFWFGTDTALTKWRPGGTTTSYFPEALAHNSGAPGIVSIVAAGDGLWTAAPPGKDGGVERFKDGHWSPLRVPGFDSSAISAAKLYKDSHQTLWIGTLDHGLYRIVDGKLTHFGIAEGLSSDEVGDIVEDREGGLWVATAVSLEHFRDLRVLTLDLGSGYHSIEVVSLLRRRDGSIWIGTAVGMLMLQPDQWTSPTKARGLPGTQVTSMFETTSGDALVGMDGTLQRYHGGKFQPIQDQHGRDFGFVTSIAEDTHGDLWVAAHAGIHRLLHLHDYGVVEEFSEPQYPPVHHVAASPDGSLWLGLYSGDLARWRKGTLELFSYGFAHKPGAEADVYQISVLDDGSVLAASQGGLLGWKDGRRRVMDQQTGPRCDRGNPHDADIVYQFDVDEGGDLWMGTSCGYVRIKRNALRQWLDGGAIASGQLLDRLDGAGDVEFFFNNHIHLPDGRLAFGSDMGVQIIDPTRLNADPVPPPLAIEELTVDHQAYPVTSNLMLPKLARDIEIDYTALSLSMPSKVRFRYRLQGHDADWEDPGPRRQAFYSGLAPGRYTFQAQASNGDGAWNDPGAHVAFTIPPAYYQTRWFIVLVGVFSVALIWLAIRWRLRVVKRSMRTRFEERVEERERIARELHDTFLQSVQGLMLKFQSAVEKLPAAEPARRLIEQSLDHADQVLMEGRDRVKALRSSGAARGISVALRAIGEELARGSSTRFEMTVEGRERPLNPLVSDELCRIGAEVLTNAYRHAQAEKITLDLLYGRRDVCLRIADNGRGFEPERVSGPSSSGHFGLKGMHERASKIRAQLDIESEPGAGTSVEVKIANSVAFGRRDDAKREPQ
jgi:signal transduction histidine kinase/streptogramin lyase